MALHDNLPIYKKAVELVVFLENTIKSFPRYHRYAIGADLRAIARRMATLIMQANTRSNKVATLTELRDLSEECKLLVAVAKEVKAFKGFNEFQRAALLVAEISRQSQGWLNSQQRGKKPESPSA